MKLTPAPGQNVRYYDGNPAILSPGRGTAMSMEALGASPTKPNRAVFSLYIVNKSKQYLDVGPENIVAVNESGKPLKIFTREKLIREAKNDAAWRNAAVAMSAGAQAMSAAQPSYTSYSGNYYGSSNYNIYNRNNRYLGNAAGTHSGTIYGSSTTYNPAQTALANQAIAANARNQIQGSNATLANELAVASECLARNTLPPGTEVQGLVIVQRAKQIRLEVRANGESHRFVFDVE